MKFNNLIKDNRYIILGFVVPFLVLLFAFMTMLITPFGPYDLLISDASAVYIDGLTALKYMFLEHRSLAYTWTQIQGSSPLGNLALGTLFSSFNFLVFATPIEQIPTLFTFIVVLRTALCGASFAFFLKKKFNRNDIVISIFGWIYALSGYCVNFNYHIIWLDQVMMLPLVLWGVEKILRNHKHYLFLTISLAITFLMNFYMAYMTGIFAMLYFLCEYIASYTKDFSIKDFGKKLLSFLGSPVLAFGISAVLIIPMLLLMRGRDGLFSASNMTPNFRYEAMQLVGKFLIGANDGFTPGTLPNVYCSLFAVGAAILYFLNKQIKYKEKISLFILLCFMLVSLTFNPLYVAWHGFKPPVYFEGRFSYCVCFLIIYIGYKGVLHIGSVMKADVAKAFGAMGVVALLFNRKQYTFISDEAILYTLLFILIYYFIVIAYKKIPAFKNSMWLLVAVMVTMELLTNVQVSMDAMEEYPMAEEYTLSYKTLKEYTDTLLEADKDFYRIERTGERSMNDGFGIGYPSISHFNTVYNYEDKKSICDLGIQTGHNWIKYIGSTPVADTLLNIKYVLSGGEKYMGYDLLQKDKAISVYRNPYVVSMGFMVSEDLNKLQKPSNPLLYQNDILNTMTGRNAEYFKQIENVKIDTDGIGAIERALPEDADSNSYGFGYTKDKKDEAGNEMVTAYYRRDARKEEALSYTFTAEEEGPQYAYFDHPITVQSNNAAVEVNGNNMGLQFTYGNNIIYLGDFKKGTTIKVRLIPEQTGEFYLKGAYFYGFSSEKLKEACSVLSQNKLEVKTHSDTSLTGSIEVSADKPYLFTSIPYEQGWHLKVDGKDYPAQKVFKTFLGVKLTPGKHLIEMKYRLPGFSLGIVISTVSIIILIFLILRRKICH